VTERVEKITSRRVVLGTGLGVGVGAMAAIVAGRRAQAQEQITQATAQYQPMPKEGQRCDACLNWVAPNACKIVSGVIAPAGWCIVFAPKA
jgi:hypothetical protein